MHFRYQSTKHLIELIHQENLTSFPISVFDVLHSQNHPAEQQKKICLLCIHCTNMEKVKSDEFRIIWKTNCKWRDTDYIVKACDIRWPSSTTTDKRKISYTVGDSVNVKYGPKWYNAEIVETGSKTDKEKGT